MDPEQTLEWERKWRVPAVAGALVAGLLPLVAIFPLASIKTPKHTDDLQDLRRVASHSGVLILSEAIAAASFIGATVALYYLFRAIRARRPEGLPQIAVGLVVGGPLLALVTTLVARILQVDGAKRFVHDMPNAMVKDATHFLNHANEFQVAQFIGPAGVLLFAFAVVILSLNAMRAGLLSRFMMIVGILIAVANVFPLLPVQVLGIFWFGGLGMLFAGRWPQGNPPAWETGTEQPWPSRQEQIEQRQRALEQRRGGRGGVRGGTPEPEPEPAVIEAEPVGVGASQPAHPSSKKRKRKRRR